MGVQMTLAEAGIKLYGGVQGDADEAAQALAEGRLEYDPDAKCDHHGHEEGHECGHGEPKFQDGEMEDLRFLSVGEIVLSEISPPIRSVVEKYISQAGA